MAHQPDLFGTKQAAQILGVPDWRIKNFSEGAAYQLPPSVRVGSGRGSRRLYSVSDLYRLAVANELVGCGFTPEAIGMAMQAATEPALKPIETPVKEHGAEHRTAESLFLIQDSGQWTVQNARTVLRLVKRSLAAGWHKHLFILALQPLFEEVSKRRKQYSGEEY